MKCSLWGRSFGNPDAKFFMNNNGAIIGTPSTEILSDRRADRAAYLLIAVMALASLVIQTATGMRDAARSRLPISAAEILTLEATSHIVIFALSLLVPFVLNRAPIGPPWRNAILAHAGAAITFSLVHVSVMYVLRLALFPVVVGGPYGVNLLSGPELFYEFQKDAYTYVLIVFSFAALRALGKQKLETQAAMAAARRDKKITLKSGATSFIVNAADVLTATAAGNYVEVRTAQKTFLARMTIATLEKLLAEAGDAHARVHRSYIVNREHIREIRPSANGAVDIVLNTGDVIPGSRRYRDRLSGFV